LKTFFENHFPDYHLYLSPSLHYCRKNKLGSEEYAILVKKNLNLSVDFIHYNDSNCEFIRRPYGIQLNHFWRVLLFHSNPNNENELVSLSKVFEQFGNQKTLLMGDLNTGCHYVSFDKLNEFPIGKNYKWLLSEHLYTNLEKSCPYDRIITTPDINKLCRNAKVLNENQEAERIKSDHYPISVECDFNDQHYYAKMLEKSKPIEKVIGKTGFYKFWMDMFLLCFLLSLFPYLIIVY
jgi:hypothetical protein